jgi:hypothetical protein
MRSRCSSAANLRRSCSVTAVNLSPNPRPGTTCRMIASVRICPSLTRKSTLVVAPMARGCGVSRNNPPRLRSRTRETSSRPLQRQQTHTSSVVATREVTLLDGASRCDVVAMFPRIDFPARAVQHSSATRITTNANSREDTAARKSSSEIRNWATVFAG